MLLPGVPGVAPGKVLIIGGGVVGTNAALVALGIGAARRAARALGAPDLRARQRVRPAAGHALLDAGILEEELRQADLVIGATLIPGAAAPKLIKRAHLGVDEAAAR